MQKFDTMQYIVHNYDAKSESTAIFEISLGCVYILTEIYMIGSRNGPLATAWELWSKNRCPLLIWEWWQVRLVCNVYKCLFQTKLTETLENVFSEQHYTQQAQLIFQRFFDVQLKIVLLKRRIFDIKVFLRQNCSLGKLTVNW